MSHFRYNTLLAVTLAALGGTTYAQCPGEAPTGSPCAPRLLSGQPGTQTVVMDVTNAVGSFGMGCGFNVGRAVWFKIAPEINGQLTFSTCHPSTSFDTVIQPWKATIDCEFPVRLDELCLDDMQLAECDNGCSGAGANLSFPVNANETYLFEVGAYNDNAAACDLCLGLNVTLCGQDPTPPVALLAAPPPFSCGCNVVQIVGSVLDIDDGIRGYTLAYRSQSGGPWTLISNGTTPIGSGVLANWNTTALAEGYYILRLTAENACGQAAADTQVVWVDGGFDTVAMASPTQNDIYGGNVCFDGTASDNVCFDHYTLGYRPVGVGGPYSPIGAGVFNAPVINDSLSTWYSTSVPDGDYEVRLVGTTTCGSFGELVRTITVDNTLPSVEITAPTDCDYVEGVVQIFGTTLDANMGAWTLQVTGGNIAGWQTLNTGSSTGFNRMLATWDTTLLPPCAYVLRLIASDNAVVDCYHPHQTAHYVTVNVGYCGDFDVDDDGDVDLIDFTAFQNAFNGPQP